MLSLSPAAGKWNAEWRKRYFVLADQELIYYADEKQQKRKGSIDLASAIDIKVGCGSKQTLRGAARAQLGEFNTFNDDASHPLPI